MTTPNHGSPMPTPASDAPAPPRETWDEYRHGIVAAMRAMVPVSEADGRIIAEAATALERTTFGHLELWQIIRQKERDAYAAANGLDVAELDARCCELALENDRLRAASPAQEATPPRCANPDCGHPESEHQSACWACRREGKTCLYFNPPAVPAREASSAPTDEDATNLAGLIVMCRDLKDRLVPFGASAEGWDSAIATLQRCAGFRATVAALTAERGERGQGQQQDQGDKTEKAAASLPFQPQEPEPKE